MGFVDERSCVPFSQEDSTVFINLPEETAAFPPEDGCIMPEQAAVPPLFLRQPPPMGTLRRAPPLVQ
ncbi:hypothetical protein LguiA_017483 [Lonicera macranthoides]